VTSPWRLAGAAVALALLAGCAGPSATPRPDAAAPDAPASAAASPAPATSAPASPGSPGASTGTDAPAASGAPTASAQRLPRVSDTRTGAALDTPFTVDGIVVVSKEHRVSSRYTPPWAGEVHGLHPDAWAAFQLLAAGAKADGLTLILRSGYRSYAAQKASFEGALKEYDEATARLYFAEPGASEHQTGLALDAWDGRNRGTAFARTPQAAWLAERAWEYGFIIRYPKGRTDVTGYAWESWHLRWVGPEVAAAFGPNSTLTLEEYLGLA